MTKIILDFRRGKRNISLESSKITITGNSAELEIMYDRKNPVEETEFLEIASKLRFFLNKMGTSIFDSSYKDIERKIRLSTKELEKKHEEQDGATEQNT